MSPGHFRDGGRISCSISVVEMNGIVPPTPAQGFRNQAFLGSLTKTHGVIVAALAHKTNHYDGHTLPEVLDQAEAIADCRAKAAIVVRVNLQSTCK